MEKEYAGVYQLENGYWGYRFVITLESGRKKAQKRVKDENGKWTEWQKIYVSQTDLDKAIGDVETSLENIIAKYGLGGDSV